MENVKFVLKALIFIYIAFGIISAIVKNLQMFFFTKRKLYHFYNDDLLFLNGVNKFAIVKSVNKPLNQVVLGFSDATIEVFKYNRLRSISINLSKAYKKEFSIPIDPFVLGPSKTYIDPSSNDDLFRIVADNKEKLMSIDSISKYMTSRGKVKVTMKSKRISGSHTLKDLNLIRNLVYASN